MNEAEHQRSLLQQRPPMCVRLESSQSESIRLADKSGLKIPFKNLL
jgi:hypothetical protein